MGYVAAVQRPSLARCWKAPSSDVNATLVLDLLQSLVRNPTSRSSNVSDAEELSDALEHYVRTLPSAFSPSPGILAAWFDSADYVITVCGDRAPALTQAALQLLQSYPHAWVTPGNAADILPSVVRLVDELLKIRLLQDASDLVEALSTWPWAACIGAAHSGRTAMPFDDYEVVGDSRLAVKLNCSVLHELALAHGNLVFCLSHYGHVRAAVAAHDRALKTLLPLASVLMHRFRDSSIPDSIRDIVAGVCSSVWCLEALLLKPENASRLIRSQSTSTGVPHSSPKIGDALDDDALLFAHASRVTLHARDVGVSIPGSMWARLLDLVPTSRCYPAPALSWARPNDKMPTSQHNPTQCAPSPSACTNEDPLSRRAKARLQKRASIPPLVVPKPLRSLVVAPPPRWLEVESLGIPASAPILRHPCLRVLSTSESTDSIENLKGVAEQSAEEALTLLRICFAAGSPSYGATDGSVSSGTMMRSQTNVVIGRISGDQDCQADIRLVDSFLSKIARRTFVTRRPPGSLPWFFVSGIHPPESLHSAKRLSEKAHLQRSTGSYSASGRDSESDVPGPLHALPVTPTLARNRSLEFAFSTPYALPCSENSSQGFMYALSSEKLGLFKGALSSSQARSLYPTASALTTAASALYTAYVAKVGASAPEDDVAVQVCVALRRREARNALTTPGLGSGLTADALRASGLAERGSAHRRSEEFVALVMRDEVAWMLASAGVDLSPRATESVSLAQVVALRYLSRRCDDVVCFTSVAVDLTQCVLAHVTPHGPGFRSQEADRICALLHNCALKAVQDVVKLGDRLSAVVPDGATRPVSLLFVQRCESLLAVRAAEVPR